jgi:hypothetical protein
MMVPLEAVMAKVEKSTVYNLTVSEDELRAIVEGLHCIAGSKVPEEREEYERLAEKLETKVR